MADASHRDLTRDIVNQVTHTALANSDAPFLAVCELQASARSRVRLQGQYCCLHTFSSHASQCPQVTSTAGRHDSDIVHLRPPLTSRITCRRGIRSPVSRISSSEAQRLSYSSWSFALSFSQSKPPYLAMQRCSISRILANAFAPHLMP